MDELDRIEALCDAGDYAAVDTMLVEAIGETVRYEGRELDTRALLAGRLVVVIETVARWKTRGWRHTEGERNEQ